MKYRFGPFELCDQSLLLTHKLAAVHIEPLAFKVLLLLLQKRERCILRDEFFDELWQGVLVSDGSLSNEIKNLRKLLGDTSSAQTYIRTVRSRGYQFIGSVELITPASIAQNLSAAQLADMDPDISYERRLPTIPIRFSGREQEVKQLLQAMQRHPLVTVQGAGGLGKTSLAVSTAHCALQLFPEGVYFISLISATSAFDALNLLHRELKVEERGIYLEAFESGRSAGQLFQNKKPLVFLDNCEHLADIGQFVEGLLSGNFSGKICCTSRFPLKLSREFIYQLSGLQSQAPKPHLKLKTISPAAKLFLDSSNQSGISIRADEIADIESICSKLQGSPLGIILAQSWLHSMTIAELKQEIDRSIVWLETDFHDVLDRHRTIETLYNTSVNSLEPKLKCLFQSLCLLPAGFSFQCANFSNGLTRKDIHTLERFGLIRKDECLGYSIHELIRQYGAFQLEKEGQIDSAMQSIANYYLDCLGDLGDLASSNIKMKDVDLLNKEMDNIALVKQWLYEQQKIDDLRFIWLINRSTNLKNDVQQLIVLLPRYKSRLPINDYHHLLYKIIEYCNTANIYQLSVLPYFEEYLTIAKQRNHEGYIGLAHLELFRFYGETQGEQADIAIQQLNLAQKYLFRYADNYADHYNGPPNGFQTQIIEEAGRCAIWQGDAKAAWKYNNQFSQLATLCNNELHQTSAHWGMAISNFLVNRPLDSLYHMNKCTTAWLNHGLVLMVGLRLPAYGSIAELHEDFEEAAKFIGRAHSIVEAVRRKPVAPISFCDGGLLENVERKLGKKRYDQLCVQGKKESFNDIIESIDRFTEKYGGPIEGTAFNSKSVVLNIEVPDAAV